MKKIIILITFLSISFTADKWEYLECKWFAPPRADIVEWGLSQGLTEDWGLKCNKPEFDMKILLDSN